MDEIPFEIGNLKGYLSRMDRQFPATWFHVNIWERGGLYHYGQLIYRQNKWDYAGIMKLEEHAEYFGDLIQAWFDSHPDRARYVPADE